MVTYCTFNGLTQELNDKALTEPDAPIQGAMVPPSYARMVDMIDSAFPSGQSAEPRPSAERHELYQAGSAAQWVASYNKEKNIPGKVSVIAAAVLAQPVLMLIVTTVFVH